MSKISDTLSLTGLFCQGKFDRLGQSRQNTLAVFSARQTMISCSVLIAQLITICLTLQRDPYRTFAFWVQRAQEKLDAAGQAKPLIKA